MSLIKMRFLSESLNMFTTVDVILPLPRRAALPAKDLPVLLLLHGMGDGAGAWVRKTAVERYALEKGVAVVMPDGGLSCYENMVHGRKYRDYITQELPELMRRNFPLSAEREKSFIAGCSMGGFGALKLALSNPGKWSRVGCFSAAHFEYQPDAPRNRAMLSRVYGERLEEFERQIEEDITAVHAGSMPLNIWHSCGDRDALRENALKTRARFEALGEGAISYHFEIHPGHHDWTLWDDALRRFMDTLPLEKPEVQLL